MRVLVTGGRTFTDTEWLHAGLDLLHEKVTISEIIEGGATGADVRAGEWSQRRLGKQATVVEAEWTKYSVGLRHGQKNPAGAIRNEQMARLKPDIVLACPGGPGTKNMIETSHKHGLTVIYLDKMPVVRKGGPAGPPPEIFIDAAA